MLHGDLKWNNIRIDHQKGGKIRLVDFDGTRGCGRPKMKWMWRDLQRFFRKFQSILELAKK